MDNADCRPAFRSQTKAPPGVSDTGRATDQTQRGKSEGRSVQPTRRAYPCVWFCAVRLRNLRPFQQLVAVVAMDGVGQDSNETIASVPVRRNPMIGIGGCCPSAVTGHAARLTATKMMAAVRGSFLLTSRLFGEPLRVQARGLCAFASTATHPCPLDSKFKRVRLLSWGRPPRLSKSSRRNQFGSMANLIVCGPHAQAR
jgi:hypothetical protein